VAVGAFSLLAGPNSVQTIMSHLATVMPQSAVSLPGQSLDRTTQAHSGGRIMIAVGIVLALWTLSGAMQTVMWAVNPAYAREESRTFVKKRLIALAMIVCARGPVSHWSSCCSSSAPT
jgi:membrane protein